MRLDWILSPVTQYAIQALGLMSCLALWIASSTSMRRDRARLAAAMEEIKRKAREPEVEPIPDKRAHALGMYRRGESVPAIAAAVESPACEVELLLRVNSYLNS